MKKNLLLFLLILAGPAFPGTINEETIHIRDSYNDFFRDFPKANSTDSLSAPLPRSGGFGASKSSPKISSSYYNQVSKSNYEKQQIMQSLSTLATSLANTAGSAYAFESSKTAATQAAALSGSSDTQFEQMGQLFQQESQQIADNDRVGATNTASQIQNVPAPYVPPGYTPTPGESVIVQAFNLAVGTTLQALAGVLGGAAIADLMKILGLGSSQGLYSAGYSTGAGLAGSAYNGTSASGALNGGGSQAIQTGAGSVQNQIYQIPQMQQPQGANQGTALPGS